MLIRRELITRVPGGLLRTDAMSTASGVAMTDMRTLPRSIIIERLS
jgi:hypothetical protein